MTNEEKQIKIIELCMICDNLLISRFFDTESDKMLDEKIDVLTKLSEGIPPSKIQNFYDILELYPKPKEGEKIWWD